jgi:hypothetical protein
VLHAERVDGIVLNLPRHDRLAVAVSLHDAHRECRARIEQRRVSRGLDQLALAQRFGQMVAGNEELRVAERLDRADAHDDLLSGLLGGVNLPVEVSGVEAAGPVLDAIPVGTQPDQLERVAQQRRQGGHRIKPEGLGLQWPEADPDPGPAARLDRDPLPAVGKRARGPGDADLRGDLRESAGRADR